jgi:hypothetical protein
MDEESKELCADYNYDMNLGTGLTIGVAIMTALLNIALETINSCLIDRVGHHTHS